MKLCGIVPPVITPMHADGSLDLDSLDQLLEHMIGAGVNGLFLLGSSGQVAYLTDVQRDALIARAVQTVAGRLPIVVGAMDLTAHRIIEQARRAADLGAEAVVVTAPLYALNDTAEVTRHFQLIAAGVPVPVLAYDVPVRVGTKLSPEMLIAMAAEGWIAAVKDSSGDDVSFRRLVALNEECGHPLDLLTGHEIMVDGMALLGADGAVPGLANVDPAGYVRLWQAAEAGDWLAARDEQRRLERLFRIVNVPQGRSGDSGGIGAFKAAMALLGTIGSATMPEPLRGLADDETDAVRGILAEAGLL